MEEKAIIDSFLKHQGVCVEKILGQEETLEKIINELIKARDRNNKIFTMGNGGSGSTASHFVSDLLKTSITKGNKRFKAISLVDNVPVNLAWANDESYENIASNIIPGFGFLQKQSSSGLCGQ